MRGALAAVSIAVSRSASMLRSPPPAAHATTRPGTHDTCNWTVAGAAGLLVALLGGRARRG